MSQIKSRPSLCCKEFQKITGDLFAIINQEDELNVYWNGSHLDIPLQNIISVDDNIVALLPSGCDTLGIYIDGYLVQDFDVPTDDYSEMLRLTLEYLFVHNIIRSDFVKHEIAICSKMVNSVYFNYRVTLVPEFLLISNKCATIYREHRNNKSCIVSDFTYIYYGGTLSAMSDNVPIYLLRRGYYYDFTGNSLCFVDITTRERYTYNITNTAIKVDEFSCLEHSTVGKNIILHFCPNNSKTSIRCSGITVILSSSSPKVRFYKGLFFDTLNLS